MTIENNYTWAPLIPLAGGFPIGIEKAWNKPPKIIASYKGIGNDAHYVNYQQNILDRNIPFNEYDAEDLVFEQKINLIVCTPPCAALSSLNTSKNPEKQGHTGEQNNFMYNCVKTAASKFDADVIMIENAPALATNKGKLVADKLYAIGKELGYSLTLFKTSTHFHGIPQRRDRTFACFFKSKGAVVLEYSKVPFTPLPEFLLTMQHNKVNDDTVVNKKLMVQDPYYAYLKYKYGDVRKLLIEAKQVTCLNYVKKHKLVDDVVEYTKLHGSDRHKHIMAHAVAKFEAGLGVWDASVHIFDDMINSVIGRNLNDTLHPTEDRSLTYLEALYLMGHPENYELLGGKKNSNHIAQNVPSCTAAYMGSQVLKYLDGELKTDTTSDYIKVDNWNNKIEKRNEDLSSNLENYLV